MTKEDAAWLVLRMFGLLLLGEAVVLLVMAITQAFVAQGASEAATQQHLFWGTAIMSVTKLLLAGAFAFYFLVKGKAVHNLLMRAGI